MDNHTRKLLGLTDKSLQFEEEWLEEKVYKGVQAQFIKGRLTLLPIVNSADQFLLFVTAHTPHVPKC